MSDWCKGAGRGADHDGGCTFCSFKGKPTKHWVVRPHKHRASTKPDDAVDDDYSRHLLPEALCEWCGEVDMLGRHENGCRLGLGPDEVDQVASHPNDCTCGVCYSAAMGGAR